MSETIIKHYAQIVEHMEYYNQMSPFPVYDTEVVALIKERLEYMKKLETEDYDKMPVAACKYCKNLHIVSDDVENDICMRCGSINEIEIYSNIHEYEAAVKDDSN